MARNHSDEPIYEVPEDNSVLIDKMGTLNDYIKEATKELNFLKEAAKARFEPGDYSGTLWKAAVSVRSRTALDTEKLKAEFSEDWIAEHSRTTEYTEIRFVQNEDIVEI